MKTSKKTKCCWACEDGILNEICSSCCGSGEGQYDGSTCLVCKGKGTEWSYCDCERGHERCIEEIF